MTNLPLYFHQTTVCILDDCQRFLKNNILGLDPKFHYIQFHQPEAALEKMKATEQLVLEENSLIEALDAIEQLDNDYNKFAVAVNINPIEKLRLNQKKYNQISTLVVDYDMPSMNGLEVCQELIKSPIKKILITGKADHKLAVEAFNDGLIDHFILKDDIDFYKKLNEAIDKLHLIYFSDLSRTLFNNLSKYQSFCLAAPIVHKFFLSYMQQNTIKEAYLIDSSGSFLLVDNQQQQSILAIKNKQEMEMIKELAETQQAPTTVIKSLEKGKMMLMFTSEDDYYASADNWANNLHPCQSIGKEQTYFFSVFAQPYYPDNAVSNTA